MARHRHKNVTLYRQGGVNFIINAEPDSFAQRFARQHGPSVCAMAFRVQDTAAAYRRALDRHPGARWERFVAVAGDGDRVAKGRGAGDEWLLLERLLLAVADPLAVPLLAA